MKKDHNWNVLEDSSTIIIWIFSVPLAVGCTTAFPEASVWMVHVKSGRCSTCWISRSLQRVSLRPLACFLCFLWCCHLIFITHVPNIDISSKPAFFQFFIILSTSLDQHLYSLVPIPRTLLSDSILTVFTFTPNPKRWSLGQVLDLPCFMSPVSFTYSVYRILHAKWPLHQLWAFHFVANITMLLPTAFCLWQCWGPRIWTYV